ncbi:single-stranded-DNA-specific exonuclease RecJ [Pseudogemmobacter bohemicus]|uniref:single-stranded-DNA-specific exonuclease RecJ n=1 Tax=Pseudogemmobacter bohemicus TaxID=2250708 RepID=UPI000DD444E7|nr:single-stranded-DNA-specific exonuclease RecJ [Pseudogemmobacter bohemicus]
MSQEQAFLGVAASLSGRRWVGPDEAQERLAEAMGQQTRLPLPLCRILTARGIAADEAQAFLNPQLRDLLPDPRRLKDMEKAARRFLTALEQRERIAVFADYDVDGGASAALLLTWLREMGHQATLYIPDRIDEGYGPNIPAMQALARDHTLILCVDCGTLSHEPVAAAAPADVVILDHHLGGETLPGALAVVNPNRQDEDGSLAHLCAAAVVFLMLVEAGRQLREAGRKGPELLTYLDLVALATVADVAPLTGVNRAFVRQGLRVMARRERAGLRALADIARMDQAPTAYALGFLLGPRINAGGRIGEADLGARLLATASEAEAQALALRLDGLNTERREITDRVREEALAQAEARGTDGPLVWAAGDGWHPGVVGIVAARLKEATGRPAVVIGFEGDHGKGSARSVAGVDLGASVHRIAGEGLLEKGGGHKMAAGLSLTRSMLEPAMARLGELLARQGAGGSGPEALRIDSIVLPEAASVGFVEQIAQAGPFGASAPAPRFVIPSVAVQGRRIGASHLKLTLRSQAQGPEIMAFGAFDGPLGAPLENSGHRLFHLAGRLEINSWGGKSRVQLRLDDAAAAD